MLQLSGIGSIINSHFSRDVVGLECPGLKTVLRRFLERPGLVSVLKVERLGLKTLEKSNISVSSRS